LRADVPFIRVQSAIRADGSPSAQVRSLLFDVSPTFADVGTRSLRAARANRVFCTDRKRIRTENTVIVNTKHGVVVLYKIDDPRRRLLVRATSQLSNSRGRCC